MERTDIVILLDIYGELLANSQRDALDMRYNDDLSLAEIAQEMGGISRQSVLCSIRKGEQKLAELESKLGDLKKDLFQLRLQHATNQLDNPIKIAEVKRDIARVKTIIREQQLAGR